MFSCLRKVCCNTMVRQTSIILPATAPRLIDDYKFVSKLGTGGTSKVYKLENPSTEENYVCKILSMTRKRRALREVYILKKLKGKYFPKYYTHFTEDNKYYILTDYCESEDLFNKIEGLMELQTGLGSQFAVDVTKEMAKSIYMLNEHGYVHLDIKCENFIITSDNPVEIKLIDYGTAHVIPKKLRSLQFTVGTRGYSPPEIYGKMYHVNSDVWGLGVCLWIMLTGNAPFNHEDLSRQGTINQEVPLGRFKFPDENHNKFKKHIPKYLFELLIRIFNINPANRPTIKEILNELILT